MHRLNVRAAVLTTACAAVTAVVTGNVTLAAPSQQGQGAAAKHARIIEHWTPARRAAAIPRDFVIDARGQGYLKKADGSLEPYGRLIADASAASKPTPMAKPPSDSTPPSISDMNPASGATIGASYTFQATVTDAVSVKSVTVRVQKSGSMLQSFPATKGTGNVWGVALSGFTDGEWTWSVVAKDNANNTTTSATLPFTVDTGGGGSGGDDVVENSEWNGGSIVQNAAGRIYFEMPSNSRRTRWAGYVCSGTVVNDGTTGRTLILTASHCVYDDQYKAFARNVLFIPNQSGTTGTGTDRNCANDPIGCWTTAFGVVDTDWTTRMFPDNVEWDHAYYVVADTGAHTAGIGSASDRLDGAVTPLPISFATPAVDVAGTGTSSPDYTHALGYSYSDDPNFMYCAEDMTTEGTANWWLPHCGLSGGSSGGLWVQNMDASGTGDIIGVNSWGYTNQPGMASPKLNSNWAVCLNGAAKSYAFLAASTPDGDDGYAVNCN